MTERTRSWRRDIRFADPSLKPLRKRLAAALTNGALQPPPDGRPYVAVGEGAFFGPGKAWMRAGATPLLVLDGPTPQNARRMPPSLILLPVEQDQQDQQPSEELVGRSLLRSFRQSPNRDTVDFSGLWQLSNFSAQASGESAPLGCSGRCLEQLLSGKDDAQSKHPFWSTLSTICAVEGIPLEPLLDHVLTYRTVWYSPYTGASISAEAAAEICRLMFTHWQENAQPAHCYGAQYWNHPSIRATFSGKGGEATFPETQEEAIAAAKATGGRILSWAGRTDAAFEADCAREGLSLVRIEDGFLRSVGLGAGLARGAMLAADDLGIYYDPSRPSRLEVLLRDHDLTPDEIERGHTLIELIRKAKVSKYNFGSARSFEFPARKTKILVPGQVADDAAIRKSRSATIDCANTPNVNLDLLQLARDRNPDAFLVFKPHPDVETGLRKGKLSRQEALAFADDFAEDANIIDLLEAVDAVETFSSLSGFEALLRGKKVSVHGAPFYAGWGLCEDLTHLEGRGRQRSLAELVFLSLVIYARTIDPVTLLPCSPEFLVSRLAEQRADRRHLLITAVKRHASWFGRKIGL
ncbi:hypothetical protein [Roseibium sediminicola]|uniref:Capsular polysaccharide export protein n=1 Tax=Roseibium sediminicola TaxID=2933272 RepID=A0ABT0GS36_9HYPH|nr:hypothetical protein [Roseibium sp. CAU 1639]MCK7612101.1 hypothetical protein [Roseibium sp. CAU 1639]